MCQEIAIVTMKVLGTCTLYDRARSKFEALAKGGNCLAARGRSLFAEPRCSGSLAMSD